MVDVPSRSEFDALTLRVAALERVMPTPTPAPTPTPTPVPTPAPGPLIGPAFFVSPGGNDSSPGTIAAPFSTVSRAALAMRNSSTKTTYVRAGTYAANVSLNWQDSNTAWYGYPSEVAILSGAVPFGFLINSGASNISIRGLRFSGFRQSAVDFMGPGMSVENCTFDGIGSTDTGMAAIVARFTLGKTSISHNKMTNCSGPGIAIQMGPGDPGFTDTLTIDRNWVENTNTVLNDSGAIYIDDRSHSMKPGSAITNNFIRNYGRLSSASLQGIGIYLDDNTSNMDVKGNVVCGTGTYAMLWHGGDHNTVRDNIFDLSKAYKLALYQGQSLFTQGGGGLMAANVFQNNIVFSSNAPLGNPPWDMLTDGMPIQRPAVASNLYFAIGGAFLNSGQIVDASPLIADPLFVNVAASNYQLKAGSPALLAPIRFVPGATDVGPA